MGSSIDVSRPSTFNRAFLSVITDSCITNFRASGNGIYVARPVTRANKLFLTIDWFVYNRLCSRRTHASDRWRQRVREPIHAQIPVFHRFFMRRQSSRSCAGGSPAGQIGGRIIDDWAPHGWLLDGSSGPTPLGGVHLVSLKGSD